MEKEKLIGYEIYVKSFMDSTGDGIGDIKGIITKLDYLKELGINLIWLTPIFQSPQKDNGYDISDYMKIDKIYGDINDLKKLIKEAKKRKIIIMLDLVLNHTSDEHKWFQKALKGDKKYQKYYHFVDNVDNQPPTKWKSVFGGSAWEYVKELDKWYLHLFGTFQPDLNWENKEMKKELYDIINFWLSIGIKGFRLDVINYISKPVDIKNLKNDASSPFVDGPKVIEYLKELKKHTYGDRKDIVTVGETPTSNLSKSSLYSKDSKYLTMIFSLDYISGIDYEGSKWNKIKVMNYRKLESKLVEWQYMMETRNSWLSNVLGNHDQPRVLSRFGSPEIYPYESATAIATFYILLRGTPFIYFGEEIGMKNAGFTKISQFNDVETINYYNENSNNGKYAKKELFEMISTASRDNARTPMHWNKNKGAGFSKTKPWIDLSIHYKKINVESQEKDEGSILNYYKSLIKIRKNHKSLLYGEVNYYPIRKGVIFYNRTYNGVKVFVLVNMNNKSISMPEIKVKKIILCNYKSECRISNHFMMRPYEALVFE